MCNFADDMKNLPILILALLLAGCAKSDDEKAAPLLAKITTLYKSGNYRATLDSIVVLRERYPKAVEARREALKVWQDASLKMAQDDVARTDILLQETTRKWQDETNLRRKNQLRVRVDSLHARYEAMCGVVKMIRLRQKAQ